MSPVGLRWVSVEVVPFPDGGETVVDEDIHLALHARKVRVERPCYVGDHLGGAVLWKTPRYR